MWTSSRLIVILVLALLVATGCGGSTTEPTSGTSGSSNNNASLNKDDYAVIPNPDAGADPAVPAEQGGKGFTGEGWETNVDFDLIGDPRAVKGGLHRLSQPSFPATLRYTGLNGGTTVNYVNA